MFDGNSAIGFCIVLAIILFATKLLGLLFRKIGLPQVLGYIIAGIIIGPALFGDLLGTHGFALIGFEGGDYWCLLSLPEGSTVLSIFSKIGVLFLMFSTGLETNIKELKSAGLASTMLACAGVAVPMVLGILIALPFSEIGLGVTNIYNCIFIGAILTATSVAITVSVLKELGKINSKLGTTIVSAAIIDDVIGIVVLSVITGIAKSGGAENLTGFEWFKAQWWGTIIMIIAFFAVGIGLGFGVSKLFRWLEKKWPNTHRLPVFSIVVCFLYSWAAEEIFGVADITGAFLAGIILSTAHRSSTYTDKKVEVNTYTIFAPVFFANIGISSIHFTGMSGMLILFAVCAVLLGLIGKIVGCGAVAKCFKYSWRESAIAGVGMMARGEVALIVTGKAVEAGMPEEFVIMTVLLILVSSILTPILLKVLYGKDKNGLPPAGGGGSTEPEAVALEGGTQEIQPVQTTE
ncbi:MAG: cation:proton antiporter [Clostridia bacterium]|nr:cation:proton antiporter [Clostridia bacterium]